MNREEARQAILAIPNSQILLELPTGFGKTYIALSKMQQMINPTIGTKILIVIPRLVLKKTWIDEFNKWKCSQYLDYVEFVTYVSFPKKADTYDLIIFDEAHHLSERCREALPKFFTRNALLLSATIGRNLRKELQYCFNDLYIQKISIKNAIEDEVLPDPKVYLIPLTLDNTIQCCEIIKNKTQKQEITIPFSQRFEYNKVKNKKIIIKCTQKQWYDECSSLIAWYKKKMFNEVFKNMYLRKSGERLNWLSNQKTALVKSILINLLQEQRTLTFCNDIKQTEELGKYCINSKNKKSKEFLDMFNAGKIKHITACNVLNEGVNLTNCKVGLYAILNSSERLIKQRLGRLLRHKNPVIIIPYYKNTRDEELVNRMLEDYNPELVTTVTDLKQIKL